MPELQRSNPWAGAALVAILVVLFALSMFFGARAASGEDEPFAGTDSVATELAEEAGAEPWFEPIFEAGSGEIESGLFALQAALGAGILGFSLGRLSGRTSDAQAEDSTPVAEA